MTLKLNMNMIKACQGKILPQPQSKMLYLDKNAVQVHTLLKGLEKIAASADIPMLVAGDFNSVPGSAAHSLLVNRIVENNHPVWPWPPSNFASYASLAPVNRHTIAYFAINASRSQQECWLPKHNFHLALLSLAVFSALNCLKAAALETWYSLCVQGLLYCLQELQNDPLGILRPASKLQHNLHLASAYAAVHEARDGGPALQKQKRRMDPKYHEPKVRGHVHTAGCY